jgi:hypothetical protein
MARDMALLREPQTQPPSIRRPPPRVPGNLERRADSTRAPPSCCPDQQGQLIKGKGFDRSLCGRTLAGPPSPIAEETSSSGLGVQRIPRPDMGDPGNDKSIAHVETPGRNILGYFQLAIRRTGAFLQYRNRKGPGKASCLI